MSSLARLTSLSTQTLSLLLERQRLQTLPTSPGAAPTPALHIPQIARNMAQLRTGVLALEAADGRSDAAALLRSQHERMRAMLGPAGDAAGVQRLEEQAQAQEPSAPSSSHGSPSPEPAYAPYTDDPEADAGTEADAEVLHAQRQLMDAQDVHLDRLAHSLSRQHDISLQINDELDVHTGLLAELDLGLGHTHDRLSGARRRLDRVARGAKENGSTVMIALLILVLLILIIVFKT
ncbi:hypothetical protein B0H21DRAFT_784638 [Amylocystis lapponica]|nr:hypothetical protein B0H21DRAFT_784638 [Amylocystis lapponica]